MQVEEGPLQYQVPASVPIAPKAVLPEPSGRPDHSRTILAIVATVAGSVTVAWLAFLIWLASKGVSLLLGEPDAAAFVRDGSLGKLQDHACALRNVNCERGYYSTAARKAACPIMIRLALAST